jgi:hypothetical protein
MSPLGYPAMFSRGYRRKKLFKDAQGFSVFHITLWQCSIPSKLKSLIKIIIT